MALNSTLPTLYEYYTSGGITAGLSVATPYFTLNERNITIYSGAMHYFRVPRMYWRDRFRKMRAAGLNTIETYVPWNLHEPQMGKYDFGEGQSDMEDFLHLEEYIKTAQEEDLFVLVRPGPYICAEWEFGGLPSWLLREDDIKIRTSDQKFMRHVSRFFSKLLPMLALLQFTQGGSIIGFQVENEYGSTEWMKGNNSFKPDKEYLVQLKDLMLKHRIHELLFTSDSPADHGDVGTLPDLFQTANFNKNATQQLDRLKMYQKNRPSMAMEFWSGWFDHWSEPHYQGNITSFVQVLKDILTYPASVNFYMFHGGTNWGFLNGANVPLTGSQIYQPQTTSYDYNAPLNENGDYTEKYYILRDLIQKYNPIQTKLPSVPEPPLTTTFSPITVEQQLQYVDFVSQLPYFIEREKPIPMELLPINNNSGQSYGYIIYRHRLDIPLDSVLTIKGYVHDSAMILINGELVSSLLQNKKDLGTFGYWRLKDASLGLPMKKNAILDIIVENWGRNNYGRLEQFRQFKGLFNQIYLNGQELKNWTIIPLEFKTHWSNSLTSWKPFTHANVSLYSAQLRVEEAIDTFIDMTKWNTGIVIVNGFVLGRYTHIGPQQTLYLPAPLLTKGLNNITIFEHFSPATHVSFSNKPMFFTK